MNPNHENAPVAPRAIGCDLVAHAVLRVPLAAVAEMRRQPSGVALPATFLKHADEQTVVGLSAVFRAIAAKGMGEVSFAEWGVLAAPRFLGRSTMIGAQQRFLAEGAWGVSPHVIPHRSLHSISGTVSLALKARGPNFGVGGGHGGAVEVLLAAVALLERVRLPGLWVVWTAQEPDGVMDIAGRGDPSTHCRALAVALAPARPGGRCLRLNLEVGKVAAGGIAERQAGHIADYFYLETLLHDLGTAFVPGRQVDRDLDDGIRVGLEWPHTFHGQANGVAVAPPAFAVQGSFPMAGAEVER